MPAPEMRMTPGSSTRLRMEDPDTHVTTLPNGVRVLVLVLPQASTASVSVVVRAGSRHETARLNGISHMVEHMAFKGTRTRDCQRINLDAERLGAEVNAHTDKDHTAYHMHGLPRDVDAFVAMLGDIVLESRFPEAEIERERQVILQELLEDEDDPLSTAFKLYDRLCFGRHPLAQAVIGRRANIERFTRDDLLDHVARHHVGGATLVAVAGPVDPARVVAQVQAVFGAMPAGTPATVDAPVHVGGVRMRRLAGCSQTHLVMGYPTPSLREGEALSVMTAAVLGEGMSSPLLDTVRERLGLVYYAGCSADLSDLAGQFVIEASTTPEHLATCARTIMDLLRGLAERVDPMHVARARNQLVVRALRQRERTVARLEAAVQDLHAHGRVRPVAAWIAQLEAVDAEQVREACARMLAQPVAAAVTGRVPAAQADACRAALGAA